MADGPHEIWQMLALSGSDTEAYMRRVRTIPLLDRATERDLAFLAQRGLSSSENLEALTLEFGSVEQVPRSLLDLGVATRNIVAGDEAKLRLIYHNLRFCAWVARHSMGYNQSNSRDLIRELGPIEGGRKLIDDLRDLAGYSYPLEDRIQECVMALIKSVDTFLPNGQARLISYASYGIARRLRAAVIGDSMRGIGSSLLSVDIRRTTAAQKKLRRLLSYEPSLREIASEVRLGEKATSFRLEEAALIPEHTLEELDLMLGFRERLTGEWLGVDDLLWDEYEVSPEDLFLELDFHERLDAVLDSLSEREAGIIKLRFGYASEPMSHDEIGRIYGVTRARIGQIVDDVLEKIRERSRLRLIDDYLDVDAREEYDWRVCQVKLRLRKVLRQVHQDPRIPEIVKNHLIGRGIRILQHLKDEAFANEFLRTKTLDDEYNLSLKLRTDGASG